MINSFDNYVKMGKVKKKTADPEEAKALIGKAQKRMSYTKTKNVDENTAQFILEDAYEAAREAAQALMSLKGFKPYSHEATISFLGKFYGYVFFEQELRTFDRFRQLRNDSIYKAAPVFSEDAKESVLFAEEFIKKTRLLMGKAK